MVFNGKQLDDTTLLSLAGVEEEATLYILGRLLGGGKKRKKKTYTKPKKQKHKHKKIKLRVLKFYKVCVAHWCAHEGAMATAWGQMYLGQVNPLQSHYLKTQGEVPHIIISPPHSLHTTALWVKTPFAVAAWQLQHGTGLWDRCPQAGLLPHRSACCESQATARDRLSARAREAAST